MAVTFNLDGSGNVAITAPSGVNSTLLIALTGGSYAFTLTGEVWSNTGGGTWSGDGTATLSGSASQITGTITIDLGDGTNVLNVRGSDGPITFAPSAGTNTLNVSSFAPLASGSTSAVGGAITVSPSGGSVVVVVTHTTSVYSGTIADASIGGILGSSRQYDLYYSSVGGGSVTSITVNTATGTGVSDAASLTGVSCAVTVNAAGGADSFLAGTAAGAAAGCDAFAAALTLAGGAGANTLRIDDSGSATGSKTYTITPAATQAGSATVACSSFSTISYTASGGSFAGGLRFDGSSLGGCTFAIMADFLDDATINGGGGINDNALDLSALAGYVQNDNGDGTGTVTLSNGVVITYSGMVITGGINRRRSDGKSF